MESPRNNDSRKHDDEDDDEAPVLIYEEIEENDVSAEQNFTDQEMEIENFDDSIFHEDEATTEEPFNVPAKILTNKVTKAIISSPNGFLSVEDIVEYVSQRFQYSGNKARLKTLVQNTLIDNRDRFMSLTTTNEHPFQSGPWTLKPQAAIEFSMLEKNASKKPKNCQVEVQKNSTMLTDEKLLNKAVVVAKRSSTLDNWGSKAKVAKVETNTVILPSSNVVNSLKGHGITFQMKWGGWNCRDENQEKKISKLEKLIQLADKPVTSNNLQVEHQQEKNKPTPISNPLDKSLLKTGSERVGLSDSCSDPDSSNEVTQANRKEQTLDVNNDSSGINNVICSLLKMAEKIDKMSDEKFADKKYKKVSSTSTSLDKKKGFLGFDYGSLSGHWRGWEKASTRKLEKIKEFARALEGCRDLEDVLRECDIAVTRCVEDIEKVHVHNQERVQNRGIQNNVDMASAMKTHLKELMGMFDSMVTEPPISYLVLIVMAICANPEYIATVPDICHFIQQHFPFHSQGSRNCLESLVETVLHLGSPTTFHCQKSRRTTNFVTCWKVDPTAACILLEHAVDSARLKVKTQLERDLLRMTTAENKTNLLNPQKLDSSRCHESVIVKACTLKSFNKTVNNKQENLSYIHQLPLNSDKFDSTKENLAKYEVNLALKDKIHTQHVKMEKTDTRTIGGITKSSPVSSGPKITNCDSHKETMKVIPVGLLINKVVSPTRSIEKTTDQKLFTPRKSTIVKQDISPKCLVTPQSESVTPQSESVTPQSESVSPGKIHGESPCKYSVGNEDLEIIDVDPYLETKENSSLSSEDGEIIIIDDDDDEEVNRTSGTQRMSCSEQSTNVKRINDTNDRTSSCSFLQRCLSLDPEAKQYPCYICHKFYFSNEILHIHLVQTHFGKDNVHVSSSLCEDKKWKTKVTKGMRNTLMKPGENTYKTEGTASRLSTETENHLQSLRSDSVLRFSCSKCFAVFLDQDTLNLHTLCFHTDAHMGSLSPSKQVSTPTGNRFYYCDQCSSCFHTEKGLFVHTCVPFSRA